jgi:glycosyltransferase involved in cell wall biosynthesis
LSHGGLPDWRIEKSAISASLRGHEVEFAGTKQTSDFTSIFSKVYEIDWPEAAKFGILFYWNHVKKQIKKIIHDSRPDIVHAHNIFAAKIISEFGIPFIFDDHEYTSIYARGLAESVKVNDANYKHILKYNSSSISRTNKFIRKVTWNLFLKYRAINLWSQWENEILSSSCPVIVTTDCVASELRKRRSNMDRIFVVPNYPMKSESKDIVKPNFHRIVSSVFAGVETVYSTGVFAHRNLDGLPSVYSNNEIGNLFMIGVDGEHSAKIKYLGFLPRKSMYAEMMKHSIGLITYKKHWSHRYKSANKAYEYAHAGLFVVCTSSFTSIIDSFNGNCAVVEDFSDLVPQIKNYMDNPEDLYKKQLKSFNFARDNLFWEKCDDNILSAYKLC